MKRVMEFIDRLNPVQNLIFTLLVILGILGIGAMLGFAEPICFWKSDIGTMLCAVALFLFISNLVRVFLNVGATLLLLAASILLFGIGSTLALYGFFATICGLGIVLLYLSMIFRLSNPVWIIAVFMICVGYRLRMAVIEIERNCIYSDL